MNLIKLHYNEVYFLILQKNFYHILALY